MYKDISLPTAQLLAIYVGDLPDNQNVLGIILQHCRNDAVFAAQPHWLFVVRDILRPVVQRASASLSKLIGSKEKDIAVPVKRTTRAAPTPTLHVPPLCSFEPRRQSPVLVLPLQRHPVNQSWTSRSTRKLAAL